MAWISKHCYHAKNNILICRLMSHKPKFFIGDSVQLRLSSSDTLPQLWKALELHSSQAQGCKSLKKRQGYEFCKDVHPVEGAASQGTPARASSVLGFKPCSAGAGAAGTPTQVPPACTGRAGAAPAPRSSQHRQHPQNLLSSPRVPPELCLSLGWSTTAKPPWLPGHALGLCYVLTHFLPVVK